MDFAQHIIRMRQAEQAKANAGALGCKNLAVRREQDEEEEEKVESLRQEGLGVDEGDDRGNPVNYMTRLYEDERFIEEKAMLEQQMIDAAQSAAEDRNFI